MFSCCTRTRSKCCLLFLPEAKLLLYFLELLIVNLKSLKREAKYIPLVNEEINLFKSCPGASNKKAAQRWGHKEWSHLCSARVVASTAMVAPTCADPPEHESWTCPLLGAKFPAPYRSTMFWAEKQASPGPGSLYLPGTMWKTTRPAFAAAGPPGRPVTDPLSPVPDVSTSHSGLFIKTVVKKGVQG